MGASPAAWPRGSPRQGAVSPGNRVVGAGFEPAYDFRRTVLQTVAINHSATPPGRDAEFYGTAPWRGTSGSGGRREVARGDVLVGALARDAAVGAAFGAGAGFLGHVFPDVANGAGHLRPAEPDGSAAGRADGG